MEVTVTDQVIADDSSIMAGKVLLIGRSYAAAVPGSGLEGSNAMAPYSAGSRVNFCKPRPLVTTSAVPLGSFPSSAEENFGKRLVSVERLTKRMAAGST